MYVLQSKVSGLLLSFGIYYFCQVAVSEKETHPRECLKANEYHWKHLASKTPYRYLANPNITRIAFEGCVPKKLWVVIRHGTRYPGSKFITKMKTRLVEIQKSIIIQYQQGQGTLCSASAARIGQWTPRLDVSDSKKLAHEGEDEMVELAERFQNRFPSLLPFEYSNATFNFKATATQRTIQSKYYFTVGLFSRRIAHHVWAPEPVYRDPILRFYKLCLKWLKEVHKNSMSQREVVKFKKTKSAEELIKNISARLGFEGDLPFDDVEIMYAACSFESAINRTDLSPWCLVFTEKEMEVMEFIKDLKHYWVDGYGFDVNFRQACPLMRDFLNFMRSEEGRISSFYFTHSGTLLKLLSHMGLYYDEEKLDHKGFARPRLWKVGHIDAFASNLAFASFRCGSELKLLALHQERPVRLPGCPKEGLCSLEKIIKTYKESMINCNFDETCRV